MSESEISTIKEQTRRGMDTIWNEQDLGYVDDNYAEDFVMHDVVEGRDVEGTDAYKEYVENILTAFPDFETWPEDVVVGSDGEIVVRYAWEGTHEGPLDGIEPTGETVEARGVAVFRTDDDELAEAWFYDDMFGMFRQLGLLPDEFDQ